MLFSLGFLGLLQGTLLRGWGTPAKLTFDQARPPGRFPDCAFGGGIAVLGSRPAGPPACRL